jgi:hypothetical protein
LNNPNVAPTEQVPAFLAERSKKLETKMARFGINLKSWRQEAPALTERIRGLKEWSEIPRTHGLERAAAQRVGAGAVAHDAYIGCGLLRREPLRRNQAFGPSV